MSRKWWKEAVVYQIYPKSFRDSNGDGIGDIPGIIEKLDYIQALGVNVIWLCPVYRSPMDDNGYDISDYYHVDPMFGTDADMDRLIREAEQRGMKILMDLVINHTSDEHLWFQEALKDKNSKYRDYYIFRKGSQDGPPNNWRSYFGGSAWERVGDSDEYYLHAFTKKQPDLNWENEAVREELFAMVEYWLKKGLGGFRIDAILNIKKNIEYGNFPPDGEDGYVFIGDWILNQPGVGDYLKELKERTFEVYDSMTVAEADVPDSMLPEYIGEDGYFSMVFDFAHSDIDVPPTGEWYKQHHFTVRELRDALFSCQQTTQKYGWGALYFENHDQPRSINKYIPAADMNDTSKKLLGILLMFLRGTPFIYQGEELGMTNIPMDSIDDYDDIATHSQYQRAMLAGVSNQAAMERMYQRSRDNSRTPMHWNGEKYAGFTNGGQTWLKVNPNYIDVNAEKEMQEKDSVLNFYKELVQLRRNSADSEIIVYGDFIPVDYPSEHLIAFKRRQGEQEILVLVNFGNEKTRVVPGEYSRIVISNYGRNEMVMGELVLAAYEGLVLANYK